ncbi:MAG: insulinase family protein [Desulfuromonadales bacterium]|nr:insulinase family protein [Desulfuromonadales bacterium]NIR34334.1 insulinase family protein [Desulfuromonadales bacterium]NIS41768.1 insulinase family protein [Desulfuromonadales bacterium]
MFFARILPFLLLLSLAGCAGMSQPVRPDQLEFPPLVFKAPDVDRQHLDNGLSLYLQEDNELPLVEITALVGAGSIGTPGEKAGMGGLFARALEAGGAGDRGPAAFEALLERMAAKLSVSSGTYTTTVHLSLRAEDLEIGLRILSDLLRRPHFDQGRLEVARRQLLEGIRRRNDNPSSVAARLLRENVYGEHPLGTTPSEESVGRIQRRDLLAFHDEFFVPNNLKLAITGDFEKAKLLSDLKEVFGGWERAEFTPPVAPPVDAEPQGQIIVAPKEVPQATIVLGHLGIDKDDPDLFPVRVMNYILGGGGFNSRMMREVRSNRGLAYSVYSRYQVGRRLPGLFVAGSETRTATTVEVVELMRGLMEQMRRQPVSEEELALARESLVNSFVFAFTDTHSVVARKMRLDHFDYPADYLQTYRQRVAAVTAEDVLRAAREHLHPERLKIVLVGATDEFKGDLDSFDLPVDEVSLKGGSAGSQR